MKDTLGTPRTEPSREEKIWLISCPACDRTIHVSEIGYTDVAFGDIIIHTCECGVDLIKTVGINTGIKQSEHFKRMVNIGVGEIIKHFDMEKAGDKYLINNEGHRHDELVVLVKRLLSLMFSTENTERREDEDAD